MRAANRTLGRAMTPMARLLHGIRPGRSLTLLGWHRIGDADDGLTTRPDDFRRHLDEIEAWGGTVLPLDEGLARLRAGTLPPRAVALTFDDGYASVAEVAWPELVDRGMPATLYAVSGFLDGRRSFPWDACLPSSSPLVRLVSAGGLRDLADAGMDIGSHTASHRWLPGLTTEEVSDEVRRSRADLEDLLGRTVRGLAYPMGGWTPQIRDLTAEAGYEYAITVDRGRNGPRHPALELRRAFAFDRPDDVRRQLEGAFTWMRPIEDRRRRQEPTW